MCTEWLNLAYKGVIEIEFPTSFHYVTSPSKLSIGKHFHKTVWTFNKEDNKGISFRVVQHIYEEYVHRNL